LSEGTVFIFEGELGKEFRSSGEFREFRRVQEVRGVQKVRSRNIANKSADCLSHSATPELLQLLNF
jgi:hypothetical protein